MGSPQNKQMDRTGKALGNQDRVTLTAIVVGTIEPAINGCNTLVQLQGPSGEYFPVIPVNSLFVERFADQTATHAGSQQAVAAAS